MSNKGKTVAFYSDYSKLTVDDIEIIKNKLPYYFNNKSAKLKDESVCVRGLLCYMLNCLYGITDFKVSYNVKSKPYIVGNNFYFNFSHSDKYIFCAVSDFSVGCDVQQIKNYSEKIVSRFFSFQEAELLKNSADRRIDFFKLWTLKEAILKQKGVGISGGLSKYDFSSAVLEDKFTAYDLNFKSFIYKECYYSVCSETDNITVSKIDIIDVLNYMLNVERSI